MKKDISKRKTPLFCISKGLLNKQKKKFRVIYTQVPPRMLLARCVDSPSDFLVSGKCGDKSFDMCSPFIAEMFSLCSFGR